MRGVFSVAVVAAVIVSLFGFAACGVIDLTADEEPGPTQGSVLGPLTLTAEQLRELAPAADDVATSMVAQVVESERGGFRVPVDLPQSAAQAQWTYWSMDSGDRSMGVAPVDYALVQLVLVEDNADVQPIQDAMIAFDAEWLSWSPTTIAGAATAHLCEPITQEGEPDDEPEFSSVLASRGQLIVIVTAFGSDPDATDRAAKGITETVFEQARRFER